MNRALLIPTDAVIARLGLRVVRLVLPALAIACVVASVAVGAPARTVLPLDGEWQIADSRDANDVPAEFTRTVPVPGLANLARPAFPDVDRFRSREYLANAIRSKELPVEWMRTYWNGKVDQDRNYFWYRKTFKAPPRNAVAWLRIAKAQFGTAVWLNGQKLGDYAGCFSASSFRVDHALRWDEENTVLVRIGAHPAVLPADYPTGSDFEKTKWTPGIYDSVSLICCDNPAIETIQVAPRIATGDVVIQTKLTNHSAAQIVTPVTQTVEPWKSANVETASAKETVTLRPGESRVLTQTLRLTNARLWSPEDPFLYVVTTSTAGDTVRTRFGMRELHFSADSQRAHLNGQVYFLRGSNIALHRFFEDPACGDLPWNEAWVRRLLGEIPRTMHWNYFRFAIGPVPERWFELCDELGLLVQNEFPVWIGSVEWYPGLDYSRRYNADEMIRQFADWMRDHWNHPSVVLWDANNESVDERFGERIIPAVRPLDLSNRAWENSFNAPVTRDDPVEYHPYLMQHAYRGKLTFQMSDLERGDGALPPGPRPNPAILNEYGWMWLNRDGTPTLLTENIYAQLLGLHATPRERLELWAYLLAGKTEYWRAHRKFAAIGHFVYLTGSFPGAYTADHFEDVRALKLDPAFADYVGESFKPLGVFLTFFQPRLAPGAAREFLVKLVNDLPRPLAGDLVLTLETRKGEVLARSEKAFAVAALGAGDVTLSLTIPSEAREDLLLVATATPHEAGGPGATRSRRWVAIRP